MPRPNNGTLRLPLSPVGLHSPEILPLEPADPAPSASADALATTTTKALELETTSASLEKTSSAAETKPSVIVGVDPTDPATERPVVDDEKDTNNESLWDYLLGKVDDIKSWIEGLVDGEPDKGSK